MRNRPRPHCGRSPAACLSARWPHQVGWRLLPQGYRLARHCSRTGVTDALKWPADSDPATAGFFVPVYRFQPSSCCASPAFSQLPSANKRGISVTICHKKQHFSQTFHHESWHHAGDEFLFGFISTPNNSSMSLYKEIPC